MKNCIYCLNSSFNFLHFLIEVFHVEETFLNYNVRAINITQLFASCKTKPLLKNYVSLRGDYL